VVIIIVLVELYIRSVLLIPLSDVNVVVFVMW